jgi:VanZ family protein
MWERGRSSDSGLPLRGLPDLSASGVSASGVSPHSGGTVPDLHRVPSPCSLCGAGAYHGDVSPSALRLWAPVVLWAAVIFALSSVSDLGTGLGTWDLVLRKVGHAAEFAVLGALLLRALRDEWVALAAGIAYAVTDEVHQHFVPGRVGAPVDVAIDAVGVGLGVLLWRRYRR